MSFYFVLFVMMFCAVICIALATDVAVRVRLDLAFRTKEQAHCCRGLGVCYSVNASWMR